MATNGTVGNFSIFTPYGLDTMQILPVTIVVITVFLAFLIRTLSPRIDPREPPLVKPRIPLIGHIIGMMRHQAEYHIMLQ